MSFRHILFATDLSPASAKAFAQAVGIARANEAELVIAHAYQLPDFFPTDVCVTGTLYSDLDEKVRGDAEKKLAALVKDARSQGIGARFLVLTGAPFEAIAEAARAVQADLIVMGTHGRTGASRILLGSVAARVITTASCPVMTVRAA
jgi:nucleotide-binding universal stress UspA family protein